MPRIPRITLGVSRLSQRYARELHGKIQTQCVSREANGASLIYGGHTVADIFTVEKRSEIMSRIKSKNTGPEKKTAILLREHGFKFKMHAGLIGKPDFVLFEEGIILFVDGEFWHGHTMTPRKWEVMSDFWRKKITRNVERDREVTLALRKIGWTVLRVTDRDVNVRPEWVISKIWRSRGQLLSRGRRNARTARTDALRKTLTKNNTRCQKTKKICQKAAKRPERGILCRARR